MQFWDAAQQVISIHAPREGGDVIISMALRKKVYFNPRPPRGGRPARLMMHPTMI